MVQCLRFMVPVMQLIQLMLMMLMMFIGKSNQRWFDIEGMLCYNKGEEPPIDGWPSEIS